MTVRELAEKIRATVLTGDVGLDRNITCGYCCDLLSWAMEHGREGMAWVTVQTHMNVIAVATLLDMSCVIAPEEAEYHPDVIEKAKAEGLSLLTTSLNAFDIARAF